MAEHEDGAHDRRDASVPERQLDHFLRRSWLRWQQIATIVAALGLGATLVVNTLQLSNSAAVLDQTRRASELQQLTQVEAVMRSANGIFATDEVANLPRQRGYLERRWGSQLARKARFALGNMDYAAFLFEYHYMTLPGAEARWKNTLICASKFAAFELPHEAADQWPALEAFGAHLNCRLGAQPPLRSITPATDRTRGAARIHAPRPTGPRASTSEPPSTVSSGESSAPSVAGGNQTFAPVPQTPGNIAKSVPQRPRRHSCKDEPPGTCGVGFGY